MNLIMDQAMMENYKFVWYLHGTYLNHIFHLKKNYLEVYKLLLKKYFALLFCAAIPFFIERIFCLFDLFNVLSRKMVHMIYGIFWN